MTNSVPSWYERHLQEAEPGETSQQLSGWSDPGDVARVEDRTFICSISKQDAGPTTTGCPERDERDPDKLFKVHARRTCMLFPSAWAARSPIAKIGIEITDSPYVAVNMRIMTRMGKAVLDVLGADGNSSPAFIRLVLLWRRTEGCRLPCNKEKYIVHFPEERSIWSYGSGYGGNALLGKNVCPADCLQDCQGRRLAAEHMLILALNPLVARKPIWAPLFPAPAVKPIWPCWFPRDLQQEWLENLHGWRMTCLDQACPDGQLYAINPEYGFSAWPPAPRPRRTRTPWLPVKETPFSPMWR